jgi:hypothetical protein
MKTGCTSWRIGELANQLHNLSRLMGMTDKKIPNYETKNTKL